MEWKEARGSTGEWNDGCTTDGHSWCSVWLPLLSLVTSQSLPVSYRASTGPQQPINALSTYRSYTAHRRRVPLCDDQATLRWRISSTTATPISSITVRHGTYIASTPSHRSPGPRASDHASESCSASRYQAKLIPCIRRQSDVAV